MTAARRWDVLLLGGASSVGKSRVAARLARHFDLGLTEVDDIQVALERMTSPEQYPELHFWRLHREAALAMTVDEHLDFGLRVGRIVGRALEAVIANHLDGGAPVLIDGDFIHPSLAAQPAFDGIAAAGRVRAAFLYEPDERQILANFRAREGEEQPLRARVSWRYSEWLRGEAGRLGLPTVPARPWDSLLARLLAALDPTSPSPGPPRTHTVPRPRRALTAGAAPRRRSRVPLPAGTPARYRTSCSAAW